MAFSYVTNTGDGSQRSFSFSFVGQDEGYLREDDILATVDGAEAPFILTSPNTLEFDTAPASGSSIIIRRAMPKDLPFADFSRGNNFGPEILNNSFLQSLYIIHEALDGWFPEGFQFLTNVGFADDVNFNGYNIDNVGTLTAEDISIGPLSLSAEEIMTEAYNWAQYPVDDLVPEGNGVDEYSAYHYSVKAEGSADAAAISESNASDSEDAADTSATNASNSASAAATSESNAATSESNAASSESAAATSESNAANSETNAANSASAAASSATSASNSASQASQSETNAAQSETNAAQSETNAAASEAKAQDWAEEDEDVEVEPGQYSAKHYSKKAEEYAATIDLPNASNNGSRYIRQKADETGFEYVDSGISGVIDARVYGALGDNLDYTTELQAAIDAAEGKTLYIPAGDYKISSALIVKSYTTIILNSTANIWRDAEIDNMIRNYSDGVSGGHSAATSIIIDGGNWHCESSTYTSACTPIAFGHAQFITIKNASVFNVSDRWHAVEVNGCRDVMIEKCFFDGGGDDNFLGECIQVDHAGDSGAFPWYGPYDDTPCEAVTVRDCSFENWATAVGTHSVPVTPHRNIQILNNDMSVSRAGVAMLGWWDVVVDGNKIFNNYTHAAETGPESHGIQVDGRNTANNNIHIVNNTFDRWNRGSHEGRSIFIRGDSATFNNRYIMIRGNVCRDASRHNVGIDYAKHFVITGNDINPGGGTAEETVSLYVYGCEEGSVSGNMLGGPFKAAPGDGSCSNVIVSGNTVMSFLEVNNGCSNILAQGNVIDWQTRGFGGAGTVANSNLINGSLV